MRPTRVEYIVPGQWEDDDDDQAPALATGSRGLVRGPSFVPAAVEHPPAVVAPVTPAWLTERQPLTIDAVWTPADGARESTSAMDRAKALRVRLVPFLLTWGLIAVVAGVIVAMVARQWPAGALLAMLVFSGLTAVTYYRLNRTDYEFSREGTERHRLDTAADLALQRMEHEHELRRLALDAYLQALERHERGGR